MNMGFYRFEQCSRLSRFLTKISITSFIISTVLFFAGLFMSEQSANGVTVRIGVRILIGDLMFSPWFTFFLGLGIVCVLIILAINAVCRDVSVLLKEMEKKTSD